MLVINDDRFIKRTEIIWEKGTNRAEFFHGEVNQYSWVDTGSSFLPSDITAAFLWAPLEEFDNIQNKRLAIWNQYMEGLKDLTEKLGIQLPFIPNSASNNAHMFYMVCKSLLWRQELLAKLKSKRILAVFHYQSLHNSPYYIDKHDGRELNEADRYSDCLARFPLFYELRNEEIISWLLDY